MATIELMKDKSGQFRFRVKAKNGETIATSESYRKKDKALATIKSLKSGVSGAKVVDLTAPPAKPAKAAKKVAKKTTKKAAKKAAKPAAKKAASKPAAKTSQVKSAPKAAALKAAPKASAAKPAAPKAPPKPKPAAPAVATQDAPRLFSPASPSPRVIDDRDAQPEGDDIVTPDNLGEGDQVSSDIEVGDDDSID